MTYKYECPTKRGYRQVAISRKLHSKLFPKRQMAWNGRCEYFINEDKGHLIIHNLTNRFAFSLGIAAFPVIVLLNGLANIKEIISEYSDVIHEKERGKFSSDDATQKHWDGWSEFVVNMKDVD